MNEAEKKLAPRGTGGCNKCKCDAYNSDSTHSGTCVCGHTAADHK